MGALPIILQVLNGVIAAEDAAGYALALKTKLDQFAAENRDPSDEEFQALFDQIAADSAALNSAAGKQA